MSVNSTQVRDQESIRALSAKHARPLLARAQRLMHGARSTSIDHLEHEGGRRMPISRQWLAVTGFSALALVAGCSSSGTSPSGSNGGGETTVAVRTVSGAQVLVDRAGRTLYLSDQERAAHKVLCASSACEAIWMPLTIPAGNQPSGPAGVTGELSTASRSGGVRQVTLDGAPLYTFSFDDSAGQANGNGQKDSFDGTDFTWHAATVSGAPAAPPSANTSYGGGGGYGGY
jgi:predicted lipoprotein with Yx(FWY)xxD motif